MATRTDDQTLTSAVRLAGLDKAFGATQALRGAGLELAPGEIHALVGENGSGKSTLVRILAGVHRPDAGTIELAGQPTTFRARPRAAQDAGVATVFQEVLVVESQSVLANVWLGADGGMLRQRVPREERERRAGAILTELMERPPPLDAPAGPLSLSDRQACCIARALITRPRILVLDEATSSLDIETRDRLFVVLRRLKAEGTGVIFISHRMEEIEEIADRVTVMRSGQTVATLPVAEADTATLVGLMTGAESLAGGVREHTREPGRTLFDATPVAGASEHPINPQIRAGEIVGLAGLEGHGQQTFLRAIAHTTGDETAYIPRERRADSMFMSKSIRENFGMPTVAEDRRAGLVGHERTRRRLEDYTDRLGIVMGGPEDPISTLSGGNQQKVVIARWLAAKPEVLLLDDPTRGIDLNAKRDLYALLDELADEGLGIVMLSSEVDEHLELMDRVIVFRQGRPFCEFSGADLTRERLVGAYFGQVDGDAGAAAPAQAAPGRAAPDQAAPAAAAGPAKPPRARQPWLFAALLSAVLLVVNVVLDSSFADPSNWPEQLAAFAPLVLVAFATTPAVIGGGGGIDISVGPVAIMGNVLLVQTLFDNDVTSAWVCIPIVLGLSVLVGALNGALVAYGRYQPVIATLCMFFIVLGVTSKLGASPTKVPDGSWVTPLGDMVGPVPGALILIALPLLVWGLLGRLGYLRTLYAVGGNGATAFSAGIDVRATRLIAYTLGGLFAGVAALAITALFQASAPSSISTYILIALTGVALGGTPFFGGRGGLLCSLIGALAIYLLQTVLSASGVPNVWLDVVYGTLLLIGVIVGALLARPRGGPAVAA